MYSAYRYSIKCHSYWYYFFLLMNESELKDRAENMNKTTVEHNYGI